MTDVDRTSFPVGASSAQTVRPLAWQNALDVPVTDRQQSEARPGILRRIANVCDDAVLLLLVVFLLPVGILLVGTPVALAVRVVVEILKRW